jgi:hypothetical protein
MIWLLLSITIVATVISDLGTTFRIHGRIPSPYAGVPMTKPHTLSA